MRVDDDLAGINMNLEDKQVGVYISKLNDFVFKSLQKEALDGIENVQKSSGKRRHDLLDMFEEDYPKDMFFQMPNKSRQALENEVINKSWHYLNLYPEMLSKMMVSDIEDYTDGELWIERNWINYQRPTEFLPLHLHTGLLSYVVWTYIPFNLDDNKLGANAFSASKDRVGKFEFVYNNSLGNIRTLDLPVDKSWEGRIAIFPAEMYHQVYPFYNVDDFRITVSGNIRARKRTK